MKLIRFTESTELFGHIFEAGVAYDVHDRLATKFCYQMGIAHLVTEAEPENVQPNPMADYQFAERPKQPPPEPRKQRHAVQPPKETEAEPEPEDAEEEVAEPTPVKVELSHAGGPWWNVVDVALGTVVNDKALKKSDAEALVEELNSAAGSSTDED